MVPHGRRALARLSANFYKRPAERIAITGITGTNGKSTTAFLVESILTAAGRKSALIGTIEYHVAGHIYPAPHTTPEALELSRLLKEALESSPKRYEIHLKLLQIYANRKDAKSFEKVARDLQQATGGAGEIWDQAVALGYQVDPENARYAAGKSAAGAK